MSDYATGRPPGRPAMPKCDSMRDANGRAYSLATAEAKRRFLERLAATGSVAAGIVAAGRSKSAVYQWRENDPFFALQWDDAINAALASLETEAYRRAVEGCEEPRIRGSEVVVTVRRYSDRLLTLLLCAHAPERYAPRTALALGLQGVESKPLRFTFRLNHEPNVPDEEDAPAQEIEGGAAEQG